MHTRLPSAIATRGKPRERGIALIIVLAFIVLLTGLIVAYFSRSMADRQLSNSSFNQARADELARSALDIITGDLKQEIVNGSTVQTGSNIQNYNSSWPVVYVCTSNSNMVPTRNGVPATWTNSSTTNTTLIRVSSTTSIRSPGIDQTASNALSTGTSANGRTVSLARWNQHYLVPLNSVSTPTNTAPDPAFIPPNWVYVTGTGPAVLTAGTSLVIGRYAYAIYDEGALLDVNAAGYPAVTSGTSVPVPYGLKGALAFADLTQLGSKAPTQTGVNNLVGWRNYASMQKDIQTSGTFPNLALSGTLAPNDYKGFILSNTNGFMTVSGSTFASGSNTLTDQAFLTRQELINLVQSIGTTNFNANTLQYLGTFSRAVAAPSWSPEADALTLGGSNGAGNIYAYHTNAESPMVSGSNNPNRNMGNVRFQNPGAVTHYTDGIISGSGTMISPMTSGTYAVNAGDPLLQSRFSLSKIAWLSQADPNAGTGPAPTSAYATAIQACFGLEWGIPINSVTQTAGVANGGNPCWVYVGPTGNIGSASLSTTGTTIETLDQVAAEKPPREPNFFELLKAAILNGSVGVNPGIAVFGNGTIAPYSRGNGSPGDFTGSYTWSDPGVALMYPGVNTLYSYSYDRTFYKYTTPTTTPALPAPALISDMQIMQIGANIIDQYDADSYPTAIYFKYQGMTSNNDAAVTTGTSDNHLFGPSDMVYGDENLPYLMGMVHLFATTDGGPHAAAGVGYDGSTHPLGCWWQPLIWNPHQMPNPANFSVTPPENFQINGYAGSGGLKFSWTDFSWTATTAPAGSVGTDTTEPVPIDNNGTPLQYITFNDAAPTTSAFYAQPLLLASSGIPNVVATTSSSQMMATTYPNMLHESQNQFVAFFSGTDGKYGGGSGFIDVSAEVSGAATFCLGWTNITTGAFHPYSYLTGEFTVAPYGILDNGGRNGTQNQGGALPNDSATSDHLITDPLTTRFGAYSVQSVSSKPISTTSGTEQTMATSFNGNPNGSSPTGGRSSAFWGQPYSPTFFYQGDYCCDWEVNQPTPLANGQTLASATYYEDSDGVVRPGDGVFGNSTNGDGMLLYTAAGLNGAASGDTTAATSTASGSNKTGNTYHGRRQVILNRPFRSVAELGYAYRDMPFKTLDFFSQSSADAALLDVFSVTDQARITNNQLNSVVAGQVNLSNAPYPVIETILNGASKKDFDTAYYYPPGTAKTLAQQIANALSPTAGAGPLTNRADLVLRLGAVSTSGTGVIRNNLVNSPNSSNADQNNKAYLEAPVRALADVINTRTWNLMIDVIAQTGSFPLNGTDLNKGFNVQGERRYWLHVAIDRVTGKVIDEQLEPVYE